CEWIAQPPAPKTTRQIEKNKSGRGACPRTCESGGKPPFLTCSFLECSIRLSPLRWFSLLIGVRFLNECFFPVSVFFAIEPVINRCDQPPSFDKISVLLQHPFEQRQRVTGFAGCRITAAR